MKHKRTPSVLGRNIRYYRRLAGLSQFRLALRGGLPQQYISRLENGWQKDCSFSLGVAIAQAIGVPPEDLLREREDENFDPIAFSAEPVLRGRPKNRDRAEAEDLVAGAIGDVPGYVSERQGL